MRSLEKIYRRKVPPQALITHELARYLALISSEISRQVGVLINRHGIITHVIVGDAKGVFIPSLEDYPLGRKPLRGLRLVHTHLKDEALTRDDLTDLALLRLDILAAIGVRNGEPGAIYAAHILPGGNGTEGNGIEVIQNRDFYQFQLPFKEFVGSLEEEMARKRLVSSKGESERAILISASLKPKYELEESMSELAELARSADLMVLDTVIQRLREINPRYIMGEGKLKDLIINALDKGATLLIFDQDLSPSQMRSIAEITELKVIDRTQLILDIFARRAHSREGKVQVELAQLKYRLPHLTGRGTAMSRLMGGIGGRGPGETKLEADRRRVRDRIVFLERELKSLTRARKERKRRRVERGIPIVSIVGYTNAGKSTLLNALTRSETLVKEKMFATLDTASRRLRFPREREIIITDTVGFIRDLPKDLMAAFRSTLEELDDADLLLHIVDAGDPHYEQHMESVNKILNELGLGTKPVLLVFNKVDRISPREAQVFKIRYNAVAISALNPATFPSLLRAIESCLWHENLE